MNISRIIEFRVKFESKINSVRFLVRSEDYFNSIIERCARNGSEGAENESTSRASAARVAAGATVAVCARRVRASSIAASDVPRRRLP